MKYLYQRYVYFNFGVTDILTYLKYDKAFIGVKGG